MTNKKGLKKKEKKWKNVFISKSRNWLNQRTSLLIFLYSFSFIIAFSASIIDRTIIRRKRKKKDYCRSQYKIRARTIIINIIII